MEEDILNLKNLALGHIIDTHTREDLEALEMEYLGKTGRLTALIKTITLLPPEERKQAGLVINEAKRNILEAIETQKKGLKEAPKQTIDSSLPGIKPSIGHLHLVTQAIDEISSVFEKIGFVRVRYTEVDWDWYAFGALNFPEFHPARDDWETFFVDTNPHKKYGPMLLTPHTSNGQIREMERISPPIRMININKCYRRQSDLTHTPMFHQFEGLVVDEGISIVNLKGTLDYFAKNFFGQTRKTRLRPYNFRFTEPSFEIDISCDLCGGVGCKFCKKGWLELGGAGMVHPNVLQNCGVDPKRYTGFAFGWGVERTFMMKSGLSIPDLRLLYSSDLRFLRQF